jgi:DNA-binding HxlR family transcriptional regulator
VHAVVPPKVEYKLTDLGLTLSAAFCGVWVWAAENLRSVEAARSQFDTKLVATAPQPRDALKAPAGPS